MTDEAAVPEVRTMCDHICLKDAGHVERGEPHFYGYEIPSPRRLISAAVGEAVASTRTEYAPLIEAAQRVAAAYMGETCPDGEFWDACAALAGLCLPETGRTVRNPAIYELDPDDTAAYVTPEHESEPR